MNHGLHSGYGTDEDYKHEALTLGRVFDSDLVCTI